MSKLLEKKITPRGVRVYPRELEVIQKRYGTLQEFVARQAEALYADEIKQRSLQSKKTKKQTAKKTNNKKAKKK